MEEYEKKEAAIKLMMELEKGRLSGEKEGWHSLEEIRKEFLSILRPKIQNRPIRI
ncbi:MAG: hypothetical protein LBB56_07250 [Chitinispirillales bacterium]|jgi:hypothetical protein|nr:hypothetical protein [Chitinispirillales bacterium]